MKGWSTVNGRAKKCYLTTNEVNMWLQHVQKKKATRQKPVLNAKKPLQKRRDIKQGLSSDASDTCCRIRNVHVINSF